MSFFAGSWYPWPAFVVLALSLSVVEPAGAGDLGGDWVSRFPVPTHADLNDVAVQGTTNVVAVGNRGTILTSSDLISWAAISTGVKDDLLNVIWTGGRYYAVGNKGHVLSSLNGTNWTVTNADSVATDVLQCVAWTGSQLVVAGSYSTGTGLACVVLSSPDGVTWERRTFPSLKPIKRLVWASALLVGLMDGATASSLDGSAWAVHDLPASAANGGTGTLSLVWTGSRLVVSGDSLWASTNGLVWSEYTTTIVGVTNGTLTGVSGLNLSWTGSELVVASRTLAISYVSTDQLNFTNFSASLPGAELGAARFGTSVVMVGLAGHVDTQITNGTTAGTWTARNNVAAAVTCLGLAQSSTQFVGVGKGVSWTSPDGNTWTQHLLPSNSFQSVAWSGTQFVAAGSGVWTSPDGVTWTVTNLPADSTGNRVWYTVNWLHGRGYASGYDSGTGQVLSQVSTDNGSTWTAGSMSAVALGMASDGATPNPRLLAVGASGDVMISADGTTWSKVRVALPDGEDFYDVAYGSGQFAAVTTGGSIWSSPTGADGTWQQTLAGSVPLLGITRTGNEFIAVGSAGSVQRSFDGRYWRQGDSSISEALYRVLWTGSRLIAGGASASFVTSDGTPPTAPTLQFTTTTSSMTEGGSVGLIITLSQAWASQITVPLSYSGTASSSRYTPPASPVVFAPGDTSKYIVVASNDDHVSNSAQTIIVTLGTPTGGAVLGTATVNTITLLENDPVFDAVPVDQLVLLGSPVTFSAHTAGTVTYQWMKNGAAIGGASAASYTIAMAAVASAGSYGVAATASGVATTASAIGRLGVVTPQTSSPVVNSGGTISFATMVAAPAGSLSYQWSFDTGSGAVALSDGGRISGSTSSKLTLTSLVPGDTGTYTCVVTLGTGISPPSLTAATVHAVINALPIISPPTAIVTRVASSVDFTPTATASPTSWTVTGLPAGLAYSRLTGRITGVPVKGGITSTVTLIATNLHGSGPPVTMSITVAPLPAVTVGSFIVLLPRDGPSNGNLGGRLDLTTTAVGGFSGKLTMPATPVSFSGALGGVSSGNPGGSVTIPRAAPYGAVQLAFTIDKTTGVVATTVSSGGSTYTPIGYARAGASSAGMGAYNFALSPDVSSPVGTPAGAGYGQFTVPATGLLTVVGRLADGSAYSVSTYTATDGSIPLYSSLYSGGRGSLLGSLGLNGDAPSSFANNFITGPLTWYKGADAGNRSYAGGIALMTLDVDGGRYAPPVGTPTDTGIVMNLTAGTGNAKLAFSGAGLPASRNPNGNFTVAAPAKVTPPVPNVALTTLAFTTGTGLFNGQFTLSDMDSVVTHTTVTRVVQYYGVLIRPGGLPAMVGKGFFNLPQMPTASPPTTSANSPIESGEVTLSP